MDSQSSAGSSFLCMPTLFGRWLLASLLLLVLASACSKERVEVKSLDVDPDSLYSARMLKLNTLISDSGLVRYRMTAPVLLIYERTERNEWVFPKGLLLRPYDAKQGSKVFIKADSAIRRTEHEEWELVGHVQVQGPKGERLSTQRLFWMRDARRLYSRDTTYFYTQGRELRGSHFEATDDLSWYEIYDNKGSLEYEDKPLSTSAAPATSSPSAATATPASSPSVPPAATPNTVPAAPAPKAVPAPPRPSSPERAATAQPAPGAQAASPKASAQRSHPVRSLR